MFSKNHFSLITLLVVVLAVSTIACDTNTATTRATKRITLRDLYYGHPEAAAANDNGDAASKSSSLLLSSSSSPTFPPIPTNITNLTSQCTQNIGQLALSGNLLSMWMGVADHSTSNADYCVESPANKWCSIFLHIICVSRNINPSTGNRSEHEIVPQPCPLFPRPGVAASGVCVNRTCQDRTLSSILEEASTKIIGLDFVIQTSYKSFCNLTAGHDCDTNRSYISLSTQCYTKEDMNAGNFGTTSSRIVLGILLLLIFLGISSSLILFFMRRVEIDDQEKDDDQSNNNDILDAALLKNEEGKQQQQQQQEELTTNNNNNNNKQQNQKKKKKKTFMEVHSNLVAVLGAFDLFAAISNLVSSQRFDTILHNSNNNNENDQQQVHEPKHDTHHFATDYMSGFRFFAMSGVIYGHVGYFGLMATDYTNDNALRDFLKSYGSILVYPAILCVDVFLFQSGFLAAHLSIVNFEKHRLVTPRRNSSNSNSSQQQQQQQQSKKVAQQENNSENKLTSNNNNNNNDNENEDDNNRQIINASQTSISHSPTSMVKMTSATNNTTTSSASASSPQRQQLETESMNNGSMSNINNNNNNNANTNNTFSFQQLLNEEFQETGYEIHWKKFILDVLIAYLWRWLRLTPLLVAVYIIYYYLMPSTLHGPNSPIYTNYEMYSLCNADSWWHMLLYLQSWRYDFAGCAGWFWYLSTDTMLFLFVPFWVLLYIISHKLAVFAAFAIIIISTSLAIYYNPIGDEKAYSKPYLRASAYYFGVLTAVAIRSQVICDFLESWRNRFFTYIFAIVSIVGTWNYAWYYSYYMYAYGGERPDWLKVTCNIVYMVFWGLGLCLVCTTWSFGHGGIFREWLSNNFFSTTSKLTFGCYLIHPVIIMTELASVGIGPFSINQLHLKFAGALTWSFASASLLYVFVEHPAAILTKMLAPKKRAGTKTCTSSHT